MTFDSGYDRTGVSLLIWKHLGLHQALRGSRAFLEQHSGTEPREKQGFSVYHRLDTGFLMPFQPLLDKLSDLCEPPAPGRGHFGAFALPREIFRPSFRRKGAIFDLASAANLVI